MEVRPGKGRVFLCAGFFVRMLYSSQPHARPLWPRPHQLRATIRRICKIATRFAVAKRISELRWLVASFCGHSTGNEVSRLIWNLVQGLAIEPITISPFRVSHFCEPLAAD